MQIIDQIYIDGAFVTPHGNEFPDRFNPSIQPCEERYDHRSRGDNCANVDTMRFRTT